jgi:hypothetical protein
LTAPRPDAARPRLYSRAHRVPSNGAAPIGSFSPRRRSLAIALALALGLWGGTARAQEPAPPPPAAPPKVSLDQLLKLPESVDYQMERRGGATADEWRKRFRGARQDVEQARSALDGSLAELEKTSESGQWKVAPPGLGGLGADPTTDAPSNYQLSLEIKRNRAELKRAEQALTDLEVEANLAAVPAEWRE